MKANKSTTLIIGTAIAVLLLLSMARRRRITDISNALPGGRWPTRNLDNVRDITIHHSAGPTTQDAFTFARHHINTHGWPGIGYHFVINANGTIDQTNPIAAYSYHNGYNNRISIGICLVGDFTKARPSSAQLSACKWLCNRLRRDMPQIKYLMGHKEYAGGTACPGSYPIASLRQSTGLAVRPGSAVDKTGLQFFSTTTYDATKADN